MSQPVASRAATPRKRKSPPARRHFVEVNETKVNATQIGHEWWYLFRAVQPTERFRDHMPNPQGAMVEVACNDAEHAGWLAAHLVAEGGLPRHAVKAKSVVLAVSGEVTP